MSDWEDECDNVIQYDYANEDTGNNADAVDDWELSEDEAPKEVAKPVAVAAPVKPVSNKKKTPAQLAKEKEQAERAKAVELARRRAAEAEAARKAASDPNYAANKKEAERLAILQSEEQLANDLFGFSVSKPAAAPAVVEEMSAEDKEMALRAARLAAATGLSDGADGMDGINDPAAKTAAEAPSPLDGVSLSTVDEIRSYGAQLCEKLLTSPIKDGNTEIFKALVTGLGGSMKVEELTEVIRVLNVAKTEANKALQGKKKKGNNKPTIKSIGSAYNSAFDDYDDDDYGRNGVDDGFF